MRAPVEVVFVTHGEGELTDQETGRVYSVRPGTVYLLDGNEHHHQVRLAAEMKAMCILSPPLTGREVHDEDGIYKLIAEKILLVAFLASHADAVVTSGARFARPGRRVRGGSSN